MVSRTRDDTIGTAATVGNREAPIGLVAAVLWEVRPLLRRQAAVRRDGQVYSFHVGGKPALLTVAGIGAENSYRNARQLLERFQAGGLVTIGFAGALANSLVSGDIVLADRVLDQRTGEEFSCNGELWALENARRGSLLSAGGVIGSAAEKRLLADRWSAVAVDMESVGVARAAREGGVGFAAIKAITDTSTQSISIDFARCRSEHSGLSLWKIVLEAMRTAQGVRDLWMLARGARVASRNLAAALCPADSRGTR